MIFFWFSIDSPTTSSLAYPSCCCYTTRYRTLSKYTAEVLRVFSNARAYNEFGSAIYVAADMLEAWFRLAVWRLTGDPHMQSYPAEGIAAVSITRELRQQLVKVHEKVEHARAPIPQYTRTFYVPAWFAVFLEMCSHTGDFFFDYHRPFVFLFALFLHLHTTHRR